MPSKSKKQARFMAAVAHNSKFAKKAGVPQSVGREFHAADKRQGRYADGGKVSKLKRLLNVADSDMWGFNSKPYHELLEKHWNPEGLTSQDENLMELWADGSMWGWNEGNPRIARMDELIKKHGLRPRIPTYRGLELPVELLDSLKSGDALSTFRPQSVTTDFDIAEGFARAGTKDWNKHQAALLNIAPSSRKQLPVPQAGQSELVLPSGPAGRLMIDRIRPHRLGGYELDVEIDEAPSTEWADGGHVGQDADDDWTGYLKRPIAGLLSQLGGIDPETGELGETAFHNLASAWNGEPRSQRRTMGLVNETLALPELSELVGVRAPAFAKQASQQADLGRNRAREVVGVDEPRGFTENALESAGVMAGQLPIPASLLTRLKLLRQVGGNPAITKLRKKLGTVGEWFTPTVDPKLGNYVAGATVGGGIGAGTDALEDYAERRQVQQQIMAEAIQEVLDEELYGSEEDDDAALSELGYAEGGRVSTALNAVKSLKNTLGKVEDAQMRKAKLDEAVRTLTKPGVQMPKTARDTLQRAVTGFHAGDTGATGLTRLLQETAPLLHQQETPDFDPASIVSNLPPPPAPVDLSAPLGHGRLTPEVFKRDMLKAKGGPVAINPAPQSQKENQDSRGSPLSQNWYEHYGEGPEHQFFGERRLPELKDWSPVKQASPPPAQSGGGSSNLSNLMNLGALGLIGWDAWKDLRGADDSLEGLEDLENIQGGIDLTDTHEWIQNDFDNMEMPTVEFDPTVWERLGQGGGGALGVLLGSQQGGVGGAGNMLSGSTDIYQALGGDSQIMDRMGTVGSMLSSLGDGTPQGYIAAGGDMASLARAMGYTGPVTDAAGKFLPIVGDLFNAYESFQQGGVRGYVSAMSNLMSAYTGAQAAGLIGGGAAAGAGGAGAAAGAGAGAGGASSVMSSLGPALALWGAASAALDWGSKKYGDFELGDIDVQDFMGVNPGTETRQYVRNPYEGDIGTFDINTTDTGVAAGQAMRQQLADRGIDTDNISEFDIRRLAHIQALGDPHGEFETSLAFLTGQDDYGMNDDIDWGALSNSAIGQGGGWWG